MPEFEETIVLAHKIVDRPGLDPDGELCMLARQFLRQVERVALADSKGSVGRCDDHPSCYPQMMLIVEVAENSAIVRIESINTESLSVKFDETKRSPRTIQAIRNLALAMACDNEDFKSGLSWLEAGRSLIHQRHGPAEILEELAKDFEKATD